MTTKYYAFITFTVGNSETLPPRDTLAEAVTDCINSGLCHENSHVEFFKATMDEATFTYTKTKLSYIILSTRINWEKMGNKHWPLVKYYALTYFDKYHTADNAMELVKYIN